MAAPTVTICEDAESLAVKAANFIVQSAQEAVRERGRFTLVLAGGSTPEKTYRVLTRPDRAATIDWSKTFIFLGDERFVPPDDPRGNFGMARAALLTHVPVPASQVFPVPTQKRSSAEAAAAYGEVLAHFFAAPVNGAPPRFDLILLGLGEDGHTASLFPGATALEVKDAWVTWSPPGTLPPPVDRITLTYPVLNAARRVAFLAAGIKKAVPVRDVLEGQAAPRQRPAAGIQPVEGTVAWFIDEDAAQLLRRRS